MPSILSSDLPSILSSDLPSVLSSDLPSVLSSVLPSVLSSDLPSVLSSDLPSVLSSEIPSVVSQVCSYGLVTIMSTPDPTTVTTTVIGTSTAATCPSATPMPYVSNGIEIDFACDTDYAGGDLAYTQVDTLQECADACVSNSQCLGFSYQGVGCYLKSSITASPNVDDGVTGGKVVSGRTASSSTTTTQAAVNKARNLRRDTSSFQPIDLDDARDLMTDQAHVTSAIAQVMSNGAAVESSIATLQGDSVMASEASSFSVLAASLSGVASNDVSSATATGGVSHMVTAPDGLFVFSVSLTIALGSLGLALAL